MIAKNFRKFPEALLYQLELALASAGNTFDALRVKNPAAFAAWTRIMVKAKDNDRGRVAVPEWVTVAKRLAAALARKVKAACMALVESTEIETPTPQPAEENDAPATAKKMTVGFYYGPSGETWTGRGQVPKWLRQLIQNGQAKCSFEYKGHH